MSYLCLTYVSLVSHLCLSYISLAIVTVYVHFYVCLSVSLFLLVHMSVFPSVSLFSLHLNFEIYLSHMSNLSNFSYLSYFSNLSNLF